MYGLFRRLKWKDWLLIVLTVGLVVLQVYLDLTMSEPMADILAATSNPDGGNEIWIGAAKMFGCAFGSLAAAVTTAVITSRIASNVSFDLRNALYERVNAFSLQEIAGFSTSSLVTRCTNDITMVQTLITMGLQSIIKAPVMAVWAICKIAGYDWEWTLAVIVASVVLVVTVGVIVIVAVPKFKAMQALQDNVNKVTRENLTGLSVVRAYNAEAFQEAKFEVANDDLAKTNIFTQRTMAFLMPTVTAIMSGLTLAVYWIGALLINRGDKDATSLFAQMMVFSQWSMQIVMAFMLLVIIFMIYPRAQVSMKRINEVLDTEFAIVDGPEENGIEGHEGEVEFKDVAFAYGKEAADAISNISFKVSKGQTIALIGATGSGKSTVINMIPRFFDSTRGEVYVDGRNVREYKQEALRRKIGYVPQKAVLFTGTVKTNLSFGDKEMKEENIEKAIKIAEASNFVGGLDDHVSQGGSNYSGGQRQRLCIARAVARFPEILIFDDSFSALDYKTDRQVRDNIKKELGEATKIIVAQRIGTIIDADTILVLDEGKIVGQGTHKELLTSCDTYKQIALSQLSKEELGL